MPKGLWLPLMLAPWLLGLMGWRYLWPRAPGFAEWRLFRARTPAWMSAWERFTLYVLWAGLTLMALKGLMDLHRVIHGDADVARPGQTAAIVMAVASFMAALVPAMLGANLVSWLVPAMRQASLEARQGLAKVSLRRATLALIGAGAVVIPLALAEGVAAALGELGRQAAGRR